MKDRVKDVLVAVTLAVIILQFVEPTRVYGNSMLPNFQDADYLLLDKTAYHINEPERGDVIVFETKLKDQTGADKNLIKRVIGLPGDTVKIKDGEVYINGEQIKDDYTNDQTTNGDMEVVVPKKSYFCMGDNRLHSTDSRSTEIGLVSDEHILGKVIMRFFPFNKIGTIQRKGF